jgi:hypothetical protein
MGKHIGHMEYCRNPRCRGNCKDERGVMSINLTTLNEKALAKIASAGIDTDTVYDKAWLMGIRLANGQMVAAYPISTLNPLAPPAIYITDKECVSGVDNRQPPSKIARSLKKWCKDDGLIGAIKLLKKAIKALET